MTDSLIIAGIGLAVVGGIYLYSKNKRVNIRDYMREKGKFSEKPGDPTVFYEMLSPQSQKRIDSFVDEIMRQSNFFGIDSYVLASLIMTESMGNLHALGDVATDFLGSRATSIGAGQISTYKRDPLARSSFDSYVILNITPDIAFLTSMYDRNEYLKRIRDGQAEPFAGIFSALQGAKVPAFWLSMCKDKAVKDFNVSGKVAILAALFKYKNGQNSPTVEIKDKLRAEYSSKVEWFYRALIEHGDNTADSYMDRYDGFKEYFDRFNYHFHYLSGKPFMTMQELRLIEK